MTGKQAAFMKAMLEEKTIARASEVAGISRNTAYKYLHDPDFQRELDQRRRDCIAEAVRMLQSGLSRCSEELLKIVDSEVSEQVKINAINAVFSNYKNLGETAEIQQRLAQIEEMLAGLEDGGQEE